MRDDDIEALEDLQETSDEHGFEEPLEDELEDDDVDPLEEGFMKGYDKEAVLRCDQCGSELSEKFHRIELDDGVYRFCSKKCKEDFLDTLI